MACFSLFTHWIVFDHCGCWIQKVMGSNWDMLLSVCEILYHQKNVKYLIHNFYIDSVLKWYYSGIYWIKMLLKSIPTISSFLIWYMSLPGPPSKIPQPDKIPTVSIYFLTVLEAGSLGAGIQRLQEEALVAAASFLKTRRRQLPCLGPVPDGPAVTW